jgi:hypothetical protein
LAFYSNRSVSVSCAAPWSFRYGVEDLFWPIEATAFQGTRPASHPGLMLWAFRKSGILLDV